MFIASKVDDLEAFGCENYSLDAIYQQYRECCVPNVSISTLNCWWKCYLEWGELPYVVRKKKQRSVRRWC